jgi:hypothetical protein
MSYEQERAAFQQRLDTAARGQTVRLPSREFPGPVSITQPVTLDGEGGTLWALAGPVLSVLTEGVALRNLKIEVTGEAEAALGAEEQCALLVNSGRGVTVENVEVRGLVLGLVEEEGAWRYPQVLHLGQLAPGTEYHFRVRLAVPVSCRLVSNISGLEVQPGELSTGAHEVRLHLEALPKDTLIQGSISLSAAFLKRSIVVSAYVPAREPGPDEEGGPLPDAVVWQPPDWWSLTGGAPPPPEPSGPARPRAPVEAAVTARPVAPSPEGPAAAPPVVVSASGGGQYTTIGEALRAAAPGTRILVKPGLYPEALVLDRRVEIHGDGPRHQITVQGTDANCLRLQTDYARVRGLTLRCREGPRALARHAVLVAQGQLVLEDCDISSESLACVAVQGAGTNPFLRGCTLQGGKSAGLLVADHATGTIEGCEISGNALANVEVRQGANPVLQHCKIHGGGQAGVLVHDRGEGKFEECDISGNALAGVEIARGGNPVVRRCKVHDGKYPGVFVHQSGRGTLVGCDIFGNALAGVEVRQEGNPVLQKCRVRQGKQAGVLCSDNGQGTLEDCVISGNALAGVEVRNAGTPVLRRCKIHENLGAGVVVGTQSEGVLEECDIADNALAGVEVRQGGNPVVRQCKIHDGKQEGLLVHQNGRGRVEDCDVFANGWSGLAVTDGGNPDLRGCTIRAGKLSGVVVWQRGAGTVTACTIADNALAGVVITQGGSPTFQRCLINRNGDVAVWAFQKAAGRVVDCDLTDNARGAVDVQRGSAVILRGNRTDP